MNKTKTGTDTNIGVGDVVTYTLASGVILTGAVIWIAGNSRRILLPDGRSTTINKKYLKATGRTVPVEEWLKEIGGKL